MAALGGWLVYGALQAPGRALWLLCGGVPLALLGLSLLLLGWLSRATPWIHIRLRLKAGAHPRRIALSFPLPLRAAAWLLRRIRPLVPRLEATGVDELILALSETVRTDTPLMVEVRPGDEDERVEQVQVVIG